MMRNLIFTGLVLLGMACSDESDGGPKPSDAVDLGGGANSYLVETGGVYEFSPTKVSGASVEGISSVDWLWATKVDGSDEQSIIGDVRLSDGKVRFTATGKEGDALIAAFDSEGAVLWSWLVWVTDRPGTVTYENGCVFLDRYIGATSADAESPESYGLFYQWGRKDPFWGGTVDEIEAGDVPFEAAKVGTVVNGNLAAAWKVVPEGADIARGIAEPMSFFVHTNYDWLAEHDETLWGRKKTDYDPCPAGYRVPLAAEMADLAALQITEDLKKYVYEYDGGVDCYPVHGCRDNLGVLVLSPSVFVWSATTLPFESGGETKYFSTRLVASEFFTDVNAMGNRCFGQPVRCVAE